MERLWQLFEIKPGSHGGSLLHVELAKCCSSRGSISSIASPSRWPPGGGYLVPSEQESSSSDEIGLPQGVKSHGVKSLKSISDEIIGCKPTSCGCQPAGNILPNNPSHEATIASKIAKYTPLAYQGVFTVYHLLSPLRDFCEESAAPKVTTTANNTK